MLTRRLVWSLAGVFISPLLVSSAAAAQPRSPTAIAATVGRTPLKPGSHSEKGKAAATTHNPTMESAAALWMG